MQATDSRLTCASAPGLEYMTLAMRDTSSPSRSLMTETHGATSSWLINTANRASRTLSFKSNLCLPRAATSWKVKMSLFCKSSPCRTKIASISVIASAMAARHWSSKASLKQPCILEKPLLISLHEVMQKKEFLSACL